MTTLRFRRAVMCAAVCVVLALSAGAQSARTLQTADLYKLRSVGDVDMSPDGQRIAYTVVRNDRPGTPFSQVWVSDVVSGRAVRFGAENASSGGPRWSPDGRRVAYFGSEGANSGLFVANPDGTSPKFLSASEGTNHPLPSTGERLSWSPDGKFIAFLRATPGPETEDSTGDPVVISRYLYKPTASEGATRFNDNKRVHIFVVNVETGEARQVTDGVYYEHSIDWSPDGSEILFVSNRTSDPDRIFNYDIFAVRVADRTIRQITRTESVEYRPAWSPDGRQIAYQGTKRGLTSSETTMEDTHVWVMNADGTERRELGAGVDNRQGAPAWSSDGRWIYFSVQERGTIEIVRLPITGGTVEQVTGGEGTIGAWDVGPSGEIAEAFSSTTDLAQLYYKRGSQSKQLTNLNADVLGGLRLAPVERVAFKSFDGLDVEAFLTKPISIATGSRSPLIAMIHGGPHGQQGPAFNAKAQIYAARGWAVVMVNYRGSTGYGQKFADAIFKDQNGGEAKDVLYGVDAVLRRNEWADPDRLGVEGGSYGGQLTNWLITQTDRFKAAIPSAGISNLISFNYMAYYHDYLAVEFGAFPHQEDLMDLLWERSPLKHVARVRTPTLFIHGENDNDVPIAEAEQFYIALKDVGVDTLLVRYPREGHGLRETKHIADSIERSITWYEKYWHLKEPVAK